MKNASSKGAPISQEANVIYVAKTNAKIVKNELERSSLIDVIHRMGPAASTAALDDPELYIAIPVTVQALEQLKDYGPGRGSWIGLIKGTGKQDLPYRSATYAQRRKQTVNYG